MTKRKLLPIAVIAVVALCILLLYTFKPTAKAKASTNNAWRVSAQAAHFAPHTPFLPLIGQAESPRESTLASPSNAYVKEVFSEEGNLVKKGELLATLDPSDETFRLTQRNADITDINAQIIAENNRYQSDLKALKIEKELAQLANKSSKRYEKLAQRQVGSDVQWDESKQAAGKQSLSLLNRTLAIDDHPSRLARLQAQLAKLTALRDQTALDLSRTEIRAPFNGRVTKIFVSPQNRLRAGDPVLTLYDTDAIEIRSQIPLKHLPLFETAIQQKQTIHGSFTSLGQTIQINLSRLSGKVEKNKGGIDGLFSIAIESQAAKTFPIAIGRSYSVTLQLPTLLHSLQVPPQAIYSQDRIYTVKNSLLVSHQIIRRGKTVQEDGTTAFLIDSKNIAEGDYILTTQIPNAITGMKVQVIQQPH